MVYVLPPHEANAEWPWPDLHSQLRASDVLTHFSQWYAKVDSGLNPIPGGFFRFIKPFVIHDEGQRGQVAVIEMRLQFHAVLRVASDGRTYNLLYTFVNGEWVLFGRCWALYELAHFEEGVAPPPSTIEQSIMWAY